MKFFGSRNRSAVSHDNDVPVPPTSEVNNFGIPPSEKQQEPQLTDEDGLSVEAPSEDAQLGVKKAEAITLTWTINELIVAYGL
jgi:hypothetical protein